MKYFIFAIIFILSAPDLNAQDFFMPNNALSSAKDNLKPLNSAVQRNLSDYNQHRYKVIDGHVIALPNEPQKQETTSETEEKNKIAQEAPLPSTDAAKPLLISDKPKQTSAPVPSDKPADIKPTQPEAKSKPQVAKPNIQAPAVQPVDHKLPLYKNRYTQYTNDLKKFQQTNKLPKNQELEDVLQRLARPREIILFDGEVK